MIDVDRFEEQLDLALTDELRSAIGLATAPRPVAPAAERPSRHHKTPRTPRASTQRARPQAARAAPAAPTAAVPATPTDDIALLLRAGRIDEADRIIAGQLSVAEANGSTLERRDAALWATMQALRDGRVEDARAGTRSVRTLSLAAADPRANDRFWGQQFWVVLDWGTDNERYELLDECRERAYGHDDVPWRSALTLLCARLGRTDEAVREFDTTAARLDGGGPPSGTGTNALGTVTNLAEAAALLSDPVRASAIHRRLATATEPIVFDDHMYVVRGAIARHRALVAAAAHQPAEADSMFQLAVETHRTMGALPLVARTLYEWAMALTGRGDSRAWEYLTESTSLARGLQMTGPVAGMP